MTTIEEVLQLAMNVLGDKLGDAEFTYKSNKQSKAAPESLAFDAGRIDGLKQARNIIIAIQEAEGRP